MVKIQFHKNNNKNKISREKACRLWTILEKHLCCPLLVVCQQLYSTWLKVWFILHCSCSSLFMCIQQARMSPGSASLCKQWGHIILPLGDAHLHNCGVSTISCCHSKSFLFISRHLWESSHKIWKIRPLICFCLFDVCSLWITEGSILLHQFNAVLSVLIPFVALSPTVLHFITWAPLSLFKSQILGSSS